MHSTLILGSLSAFLLCSHPFSATGLEIENEHLAVTWDLGRVSIREKDSGRVFFKEATLRGTDGVGRLAQSRHSKFGFGKSIEVGYPDGSVDVLAVYPGQRFALAQTRLRYTEDRIIQKIGMVQGRVDLGIPSDEVKTMGTGGLLPPDRNPGSYAWLVVADPKSRAGAVFGWLTHDRGSGVLFSQRTNTEVSVRGLLEYGALRLSAGKVEESESLAIGWFADAQMGMEAWADLVAELYGIELPAKPAGYCTWYSQPHGGASDQGHLAELAAFSATNLASFGFSFIQIDDQWQDGISTNGPRRKFTTHDPKGPYPDGMKAAASNLRSAGFRPGLWYMPFAGTWYDPFYKDHPEWFVRGPDGKPFETAWGGTCLDLTEPGAREHVRGVTQRICQEWGFQYIKIDGLWTGTATRQQYVNTGYHDDAMGETTFSNPKKTPIETYRDGLKLVRSAAGSNVFILGCNSPQNMRTYGATFGLVDGMRIGPDNHFDWKSLLQGPVFGSRHYFLNGRIWYNDPDPVYVRSSMPLNHARLICSWVAISGQLFANSDWLPALSAERLGILQRTLSPTPALLKRARPADWLENDPPRVWTVSDPRQQGRLVVGLFNWENETQSFGIPFERLGLSKKTGWEAFDFWSDELLPPLEGSLQVAVPPQSCRILALRAQVNRPQILSTSWHVTQGLQDVLEESWDFGAQVLSAKSRWEGGPVYEARVVLPKPLEKPYALSVGTTMPDVSGSVLATNGQRLIRVRLTGAATGVVPWTLRFR